MSDRNTDLPDYSEAGDSATGAPDEGLARLSPGDHIGDFEILEEIGRGGMGVVYRAHERSLKRVVALKELDHSVLASASVAKRFRREAILAANLSHPGIVPVFQVDPDVPPRYFTMEFVQGRSLRQKVKEEGFLAPDEALRIITQAAEALEYAHKRNIIHRDIKPGNLLLQNHTERVRITDFGIARDVTGELAEVTRTEGAVSGTLAFMSPEQNLGEKLDYRTDIFSLGMTFYYILTGRVAYRARNRSELALAFEKQTPEPPSHFNPEVSPELDRIIMKMMAVEREERYATCEELIADLRAAEERMRTTPAPAADRPRARRSPFLAWGIVAAGAATVVLVWGLWNWLGSSPENTAQDEPSEGTSDSVEPGSDGDADEAGVLFSTGFDPGDSASLGENWEITEQGSATVRRANGRLVLSTGKANSLARIISKQSWRPSDYGKLILECGIKFVIPGTPDDWGTNQFACLASESPHELPQRIGFLFDKVSDNNCKSVTVGPDGLSESDNSLELRSGSHVYRWEAEEKQVRFYIDGDLKSTHTAKIPWDEEMRLLFVIVNGRYATDHQMIIDYVRLEGSPRQEPFVETWEEVAELPNPRWAFVYEKRGPWLPRVASDFGNPAPSLIPGGGGHGQGAGLWCKGRSFDCSEGLVIQADLWLTSEGAHYTDMHIGLVSGEPVGWPVKPLLMLHAFKGTGQRTVEMVVRSSGGRSETKRIRGAYPSDRWFPVKMVVQRAGGVQFWIDSRLVWTTDRRIDPKVLAARLYLSGPTGGGNSYADNIRASEMTAPAPKKDGKD